MSYLIQGYPSAIYLFRFTVNAKNEKLAIKKSLPIIKRCEDFAEGLHIYCEACHSGFFDDQLHLRFTFNIKEPNNSILKKVSSLFSFAAILKLELTNQFFYTE